MSVFDLFKIGIGPSSSHTVGPMRAAKTFVDELTATGRLADVTHVKVELFGSLGATGKGHGSENAVLWGLMGETPEGVDPVTAPALAQDVWTSGRLRLNSAAPAPGPTIDFDRDDLVLHRRRSLPGHPNGMIFRAEASPEALLESTWFSIGGGFIAPAGPDGRPVQSVDHVEVPFPFRTGADLLAHCTHGRTIPEVAFANECARRTSAEVLAGLQRIWAVMSRCIDSGCATPGVLPGGLRVERRASALHQRLQDAHGTIRGLPDPMAAMDWVTLWALAVNEENAAGGRVVTAPTNGAAGIVPAVLMYCVQAVPGTSTRAIANYLLTAGAIGSIFQQTASISGAEVGCQGEVGSASSMAAAGAAQLLGANPQQVVNAAEIGLEHHLGLTCDPVGGLVQIPCIERNAMGSVQAIAAARLALSRQRQQVSLDQAIATMMATGKDMSTKYKETSRGGLAVNIVEC